MKSSLLLWILVILSICASIYQFFRSQQKIGYIESSRIYQEYKGAKTEREKLDARTKEFQLKLDTLNREVREAIIHYDGKGDNEAKRLIQLKQKQFEDYQRNVQETIHNEESAAMGKVSAELNSYLKEYGKRNHYKFILIANPSGTIAYAEDGTNVTDDVLRELNGK